MAFPNDTTTGWTDSDGNWHSFLKSPRPDYSRHGGAADRGSADRYYGRVASPHYYVGGTQTSERVAITDTGSPEYAAYMQAYDSETDRKDWG